MSREVSESYHGPHLIFTLTDGIGCYSNVGRTGTNGQLINLGSSDCLQKGIIIHETLHALGTVCDLYILRPFSHLSPQVLFMNTQGLTVICMFLYCMIMLSPKAKPTFEKWNFRHTTVEIHPSMPHQLWCMGLMTLASWTVVEEGKRQSNLSNQG